MNHLCEHEEFEQGKIMSQVLTKPRSHSPADGRSLGECNPLTNARVKRSARCGPRIEYGIFRSRGRLELSVGSSTNSALAPMLRCSSFSADSVLFTFGPFRGCRESRYS